MNDLASPEISIPVQEVNKSAESHEIVGTKSITGKNLPDGWPKILTSDEELEVYDAMYEKGDDRSQPPPHAHIDKLSYELQNGDKRLRYFAVFHQRDIVDTQNPNFKQYDVLEKKFTESPPELVLYEGLMDGTNRKLTREEAILLGEPAFMLYLVQQHNGTLKEGEKPIVIESGDGAFNTQPNEIRDQEIIKHLASKFETYKKIDIVFGSGHAIREKKALEEFFETPVPSIFLSDKT